MSHKIVRSQQARIDVLDIADFIAETSLNASDRFLYATEEAYKLLADIPGIGALRDFGNSQYAGMRQWPIPGFKKYLIFYRTWDDEIEILRVLHGTRNLAQLFYPEDPPE